MELERREILDKIITYTRQIADVSIEGFFRDLMYDKFVEFYTPSHIIEYEEIYKVINEVPIKESIIGVTQEENNLLTLFLYNEYNIHINGKANKIIVSNINPKGGSIGRLLTLNVFHDLKVLIKQLTKEYNKRRKENEINCKSCR